VRALSAFELGKGDFADYLVREHARGAECEAIATFDEKLLGEDAFSLP
jgi:predicted nucleic-acid-binding protein